MSKKLIQKRQNVKPPSSITGAGNTKKGLEVKPDWLSFTFKGDNLLTVDSVCDLLGIPFNEWIDPESGGHGYHNQLICGHIHMYYGGRKDMGIYVSMSGKGCREYENIINGQWQSFINDLLLHGATFTRFDSAVDDYEGLLSLDEIRAYASKGCILSRFNDWDESIKRNISSGELLKDEVVFGNKAQSLVHLSFYNKALEQAVDGHWIRAELRLKKERAHQFLAEFVKSGHLGLITFSVLSKYIKFVEESGDSNKARWRIAEFWIIFLGETKKVTLTVEKAKRTLNKAIEWAQKQWAPTAAVFARHFQGDLSFFDNLIADGEKRLKSRHFALLQT